MKTGQVVLVTEYADMFFRKKPKSTPRDTKAEQPWKAPQTHKPKQSLLSLEPRLMFDAAAAATAAEVNQEQVAQKQAEVAVSAEGGGSEPTATETESQEVLQAISTFMPAESRHEVAFVDPTVPNYQELLGGMDPNIEVIMLNAGQDGVEQMASALAGRTGVDAIHLISHGGAGELQLGTGTLTTESMTGQYADELAAIQQALSVQADILVYGCDFAEGDVGQAAVNQLAALTGADVEASSDLTGNVALGGDWDLEMQTGTIETQIAINYDTQANWIELLSLTTSGSETRVNTTTTGTQTTNSNPDVVTADSVAMDASGNYVTVWESAGDIYGQRYNSAGTAQGSEFVIANNAANERLASVSMNASGAFVVAWDRDQGTGDYDIYARLYNSSGTAVGSEVLVNETTTYDQEHGHVAMAADGSFVVIWESNTEASGTYYDNVYAQRYDASATKIGSNFLVNTTTSGDQDAADIAMDSAGNFVVVWESERTAGTSVYSIYGQRYNSSGVAQGTEFLVNSVASSNDQHAAVAMNDSGNFVVTWDRQSGGDSDIQAQRFNSSGVAQGSAISVTSNATYWQQIANVSMDGGGNFAVSWSSSGQDGSGYGVYTRQYDNTGTALTTESRVATTTSGTQDYSGVAYQNGKVVVTWSGNGTGDTTGIFMQRYTAAGGNAAPTITSNGGGVTASVSVAENTTSVTTVTATDASPGQTLTYSISGGADASKFTINSSTGALSFASAPNYESPTDSGGNNVYDLIVTVNDGVGGADSQSIAVTVTNTNEAPVLADTALSLTVAEDAGAPSGAVGSLVSAFTGGITDQDTGATKGIAITGSDETNGTWYYTTNGGGTWTAVGTVRNNSALLLADNGSTRLYFAPNADYNGTSSAALTVRAWDQTSGTAGTKVTTATNGGTTAFSSATDTINVSVTAVNDAPVFTSLNGTPTYTENGSPIVLDSNVTITDTELTAANNFNGATLTLTRNSGANSQDVFSATGTLSSIAAASGNVVVGGTTIGTYTNSSGTLVMTFNSSATNTLVNSAMQQIAYSNSSDAPPSSVQVNWSFSDGNSGSQGSGGVLSGTGSVTVSITAVNDAPVLADTALSLTVAEDAGAPSGAVGSLVSAFTGGITDVDSGAAKGLAITGTDQTNGTWYYTTNGGGTWTAVGAVSNTSALLLADNGSTRLYFAPNADYNGTSSAALTVRAWDQTSGTAGTKVTTATNGGTTAFSSATDTVDVSVSAVNDAPVLADTALSLTVAEDAGAPSGAVGSLVSAFTGGITDVDSGAAKGLAITGTDQTNGTWYYTTNGGGTWTAVGAVSNTSALLLADNGSTRLYFAPNADYNGTSSAALTVRAWDQTSGTAGTKVTTATNGGTTAFSSATDTVDVSVSAVNDAPVLADTALSLTVAEDAGAPSGAVGSLVSAFTGGITDVDSGAAKGLAITGTDQTNGTWYYTTNGGGTWTAVGAVSNTSALLLADNGSTRLYFAPNADYNGTSSAALTVRAWDQTSGTAGTKVTTATNGGTTAFSSATDTVDVSVSAVNDAPVLADTALSLTVAEDAGAPSGAVGSLVSAFTGGITDVDSGAAKGLAITGTDQTNGTWYYTTNGGGTWTAVGAVSNTSALLLADNGSTRLYFAPNADYNGTSSAALTVRAWDQTSGTAGTKVTTATNGGTTAFSSATDTVDVSVSAVNDAPVLADTALSLTVAEDAGAPSGAVGSLVSAFTGGITDVDSGAAKGLAITGTDQTNGTWYYTTNGGGTWTAVGAVSNTSALLLADNGSTRLYFAPNADYNGTSSAALTVRAWDQTSGTAGTKVTTATNGGTTAFSSATDTVDVSVSAVNDAPVLADTALSLTVAEDAGAPSGAVGSLVSAFTGGITDVDSGAAKGLAITGTDQTNGTWYYTTNGGGTWTAVGAVSNTSALLLADNGSTRLYFAPNADYNGTSSAALTVRAWDQTSGTAGTKVTTATNGGTTAFSSATDTVDVSVSAVNDAPVLADTALSLTVAEDAGAPSGAVGSLVSAFTGGITDVDSGAAKGLAITGTDQTNGTWYYTTNGGGTWTAVGAVSNTSALLLADNGSTRLYFAPNADYNGTSSAALTVRAWDQTSGTAGTKVTTATNGGTTAFSSATDTVDVSVSAVNDAPVLADTALSLTVAEDAGAPSGAVGSLVSAFTGGITDVDSGAAKGLAITGTDQTNGTWYYTTNGGGTWTAVGAVSNTSALLLADNGSTRLYFAPNADYNGTSSAALTVRAWDQTSGTAGTKVTTATNGGTTAFSSATDTVDVSVSAVNDAPTDLSLSANTVAENAANGTVIGTITGTDPDSGDTKSYSFTDSAGGRFAINSATGQITVANGSLLNYEAATSHSVTVRVTDSGGLTYDETFTINLTNVNEAPTGADATVTLNEDTSQTLTAADFGFSDVDAGDSLSAVRIDTIPATGTLTLSGAAVTAGQVITVADITAGNLVFTPTANANGTAYASVTFSVRDSNSAYDTAPNTLTFDVTAVDDVPINTVPGAQTVAVDTPLTITGLSVHDIDGNLTTVQLSVNNGTLAVSLSGAATISSGASGTATLTLTGTQADINATLNSLTYQGALLYTGADTLTVLSTDGNGATDTDTVSIMVSNNAPTNILPAPQTVAEDMPLAITGISVADADSNLATVQLSVGQGTLGVTLSGGATISAGSNGTGSLTLSGTQADLNTTLASLTYQGGLNFSGLDTLTITSTDALGTADTDSLSITVTPANDAPADLSLSANTVAENAANGTVIGTITGTDPDTGDTKSYSFTDSAGGRFAINSSTGQITVADGSLLDYESATSHSVTVRVTDSGGLTYDETFTINLTNVNEAPTGADATVTIAEDASHTLTTTNFGFSDVDAGDSLSAVRIDTIPTAGTLALSGVPVTAGQVVSVANITAGNLVFTPAADANGTGYATFTFSVEDSNGAYDTVPNTLTFNVTAVNDAPVNQVPGAQTVAEDMPVTITGVSVNDVDGNLSTVQVGVGNGTLWVSLAGGGSISAGANDSSTLTLSGTQAQINAALATLTYQGTLNFNGIDLLTVISTDSNAVTDVDTVAITVTAVNDAPVNIVPGAQTVAEDSPLTFSGLSVNDVDGNLSTVQLGVGNGTLTVTLSGAATISAGSNGTNTLTLSGSQVDINAALASLVYQGVLNYTGGDTLTVTSTDSNAVTDVDTVAIMVTAVNDAPVNTVPGAQTVAEDSPLTFSGLSVNDVDGNLSTVQLGVGNGTLTVTLSGAAMISAGSNGTGTLTLSGSQVDINATLATLSYQGNVNFNGGDLLTVTSRDTNGGMDVDTVALTVTPVNDAPVVDLNAGGAGRDVATAFIEQTLVLIAPVGTLTDVDSATLSSLTVTLTARPDGNAVESLSLNAAAMTAATGASLTVSYTASTGMLSIAGTASTATYQTILQGIQYNDTSDTPTTSNRTITVVANDGTTASATQTVTVTVTAMNDAPVLTANTGSTVAEGGTDTIDSSELAVTDVDNTAAQLRYTIGAGPAFGRLELTTAPGVSAGTFTQADIIANRLVYIHNGSETTSDSFTFTVSDGAGGSIGSTTVTLTITPVNDAPIITSNGGAATAAINVAENVSAVTIVTGADVDLPAQSLTYGISGGADQALFTINAVTGTLAFTAPRDFEVATDANGDNVYVVQVRVTDSQGVSATQTIQVTVTDVAEGGSVVSSAPTMPPVLAPSSPSAPQTNSELPAGAPPIGGGNPVTLEPAVPSSSAQPASTAQTETLHSNHSDGEADHARVLTDDPNRLGDIVKDHALPQWNDTHDPAPFTAGPVEFMSTPVSEEPDSLASISGILMDKLDEMTASLEEAMGTDREQSVLVARIAALTGTALSVGFVAWALQSSALLTSCLATLPAWKSFDPLPVVKLSRKERNRRQQIATSSQQHEQAEFKGLRNIFGSESTLKPKP